MEINLNEELNLSTGITPRASSGSFEKKIAGGSTGGYYVGVDWKVNSQSTSSNSSNVTASVYIRSTGNGYTISSSASKDISVTINGTKYTGTNTIGISTNTKKVLLTKTVTVGHNSDGTKTCSFACSVYVGFTLSGTSLGTVSASGTGTFNTINLNTAPVWVSGGRVTIKNGNTILTDSANGTENAVKFPENVDTLNISWSGATDANGDTITYELYEQVSESSWTNIYTGTAKSYSRSIGGGASTQGKSYDYYVKAKDSKGVYASGEQNGTQVQKNTLTGSTLTSSSSINNSTSSIAFTWGAGSNTDGSAVKYDLTVSGLTIYNATNLTGTSLNVAIVSSAPSSGAYILKKDLKNKFSSSSYNGTLSFTLTTKNNYGSTKTSTKTLNVDLRVNPTPATPSIDKTTNSTALHTVASTGNKYFVPDGSKKIRVNWSGGSDALGTALKYDVQVKIGTGAYETKASNLTSTSYDLVLQKQTSSLAMVVRVITKTSYNYTSYKDTSAETLHYYNQPSVSLLDLNRTSTSATAKLRLNANTSIPNVNFTTRSFSGASSGTLTNTKDAQTITANNLVDTSTYSWTIKVIDDVGLYTTAVIHTIEIPSYTPLFSVREKGVGVNAIPDGSAGFIVKGGVKITGGLTVDGKKITGDIDTSNLVKKSDLATGTSYKGKVANIGTDGVMEVGKYIDFHDNSTNDYNSRLTCDGNTLTVSGNLATGGNITTGGTLIAQGHISLPSNGGSWLNGATNGNIRGSKQSSGSYHPIISQTTYNNHKISLGGLGDEFGFYLYDANRTANGIDRYFRFHLSDKTLHTDCRTHINEWLYLTGNYGVYFSTHGGGWFMQDSTWMRAYGNKGIYSTGTARITSAEHRYIKGNENGTNTSLDFIAYDGKALFFNPSAGSGASVMIDRSWSGNSGTEPSFRNNKGNGWGFIGNSGQAFYRVYGSGGSVSDRAKKYEITKSDIETQYDNVKHLNIYNYRSISTTTTPVEELAETYFNANFIDVDGSYITSSKVIDGKEYDELDENLSQEEIKELRVKEIIEKNPNFGECKRQDLSLGCMIDEMPLETTFYDNEGGDGKAVDMYSYTTMILGATKHLINKVETLEKENEELKNRLDKLEELLNGIINKG